MEVNEEFEYTSSPVDGGEKEIGYKKIGDFFTIDTDEESVKTRILSHLPTDRKYFLKVRQAETKINEIYMFTD